MLLYWGKMFGYDQSVAWIQKGEDLTIDMPKNLAKSPVYTLSITPKPI